MAFSYPDLVRIKNKIISDKDSLSKGLSNFSTLVTENVNNEQVWYGSSSSDNKMRFDKLEEKFETYKGYFEKEIVNVEATINNWQQAEE